MISTTRKPRVRRLADCPYCGGGIAIHPDSVLPHKPSPYFRRLQKSEQLVLELAGAVKAVLRAKKVLEQWLVDCGFVDSALL